MIPENILIIDTETGGLDPYTHSILSLGLVSWCGTHQTEIFILEDQLITDPRAMEINRIDLEWLSTHAVSPEKACILIDEFIEKLPQRPVILVGHNIAFDLHFLKRLYRLAGRSIPPSISHRSIDTHSLLWLLAEQGHLPKNACTSDGAFKHFQVAPPEELRHTALGDAVATRLLLEKIIQQSNR